MELDPCELPDELKKIAEEKLGETSAKRSEALILLRNLINDLPVSDRIEDLSDLNLVRFLRFRKYDIQRALESTVELKRFYTGHKEVLSNLHAAEFAQFNNFVTVLSDHDSEGRVIVIFQPAKGVKVFTPEFLKTNPRALLRCNIWMFDTLSKDVRIQVCGFILFNTFKNFTFWDQMTLSKMATPSDQIDSFRFIQILGIRFAGAYIFEQPFYISWIFYLMKPFMSSKMMSRLHLCGNDYEIIKTVLSDISVLPTILGGDVEDCGSDPTRFDWIAYQISLENESK